MAEAEVSLRLAFGLIASGKVSSQIEVAIDGAQVRTGNTIHFPIVEFLTHYGWRLINHRTDHQWRGLWENKRTPIKLSVHSSSGQGDVVAELSCGRTLRVESKKGTLQRSKSSSEYPLMREALGQLLTVEEASETDVLAIAVPASEKFEQLAAAWRNRPLIKQSGIAIATIDRSNKIRGLAHVGV